MAVRESGVDKVDLVILPPSRDLGDGFTVRRALPQPQRRMVGPFIFFDQMGPVELRDGQGLDVRPHPHIGLATVTYLIEGEIMHRDSLGSVQPIRPGALNWMSAGSGIVHSERSPDSQRHGGAKLFGLQLWVALPAAEEESAPSFVHHDADEIPSGEMDGVSVRQIVGAMDGLASPVKTLSEMIYAEIAMPPRTRYRIPGEQVERAFYLIEGGVSVDGQGFGPSELRAVLYDLPYPSKDRPRSVEPCPLSARELEVLKRLAQGMVYKQIAHELSLSTSTVRTHLHNIYGKLGAVDRAQAVLYATEQGWL